MTFCRYYNRLLSLHPIKHDWSKGLDENCIDLNATKNVFYDNSQTEEDILIAHRLPSKGGNSNLKNGRHHPTIVCFLSRHKRNEIFVKGFNVKDISNFPINQMNHLFIKKNLTQRRKHLFWQAK